MDEEMTIDEAISLVESRDGKPREDDWDLMSAAQILARGLQQIEDRLVKLVDERRTIPPNLFVEGRIEELSSVVKGWTSRSWAGTERKPVAWRTEFIRAAQALAAADNTIADLRGELLASAMDQR